MTKTHKRQHTIPESYQELFADPTAPRRKLHVWVISKDGREKALWPPSNTFVENEMYTINLSSGERELIVERTLAEIEGVFMNMYHNKISKRTALSEDDRVGLSLFVAAMLARPRKMKTH